MMLEDLYRLLRSGHVQAQVVVDTITQPLVVLDQSLSVITANNAFVRAFKVSRDDILGENFFTLGNGQWDNDELRHLIGAVIPKTAAVIGFEVKHDFPVIGQRTFLVDARRLVHPDDNSMSLLVLFDDVTERQRHDAEMDFIVSEMRHRMKNLFAVVRSIAMQTDVTDRSASEYRTTFLGRLDIALRAQEIAATKDSADFEALLNHSIGEIGRDRVARHGPAVSIGGSKVLSVGMIFHELTTNAAKYGALSTSDGRVDLDWLIDKPDAGPAQLICHWRERGGPEVQTPARKGYGTELIEGTSAHIGASVELTYDRGGLTAVIQIPL